MEGLDSQLWHACAGGMVQMPAVNSRVYYFPQGHAEHCGGTAAAAATIDFPATLRLKPAILCRVVHLHFLADPDTDEVFARIRLQPISSSSFASSFSSSAASSSSDTDASDGDTGSTATAEKPQSFAKTLTQSDANNGGGFSVPRYCAETIFPRLDYTVDPPVQNVLSRDVHGTVWKFRHIYRGTPRRHLLTTGWSNFVNHKKLVAGDSIVFLRSAVSGELCVGIRRSARSSAPPPPPPPPSASSNCSSSSSSPTWQSASANGFSRKRAGKVSASAVAEAAASAATGRAFEVVYYPRASTPEFCVKAAAVEASVRVQWAAGMRFKMAFETEDSSRISWFMGTVSMVHPADPLNWPSSPWRLLQVTWDEPELLQNVKRVSPWLVEVVAGVAPIQLGPFTQPKKKLRVSHHPDFQLDPLAPAPAPAPAPPTATATTPGLGFAAGGGGGGGGFAMSAAAAIGNGVLGFGLVPPQRLSISGSNSNSMGTLANPPPWNSFCDSVSTGASVGVSVPAGMQGARHGHIYGFSLSDLGCPGKKLLFLQQQQQQQQEVATPVSTELNIGCLSQTADLGSSVQDNLSCVLTIGNSVQSERHKLLAKKSTGVSVSGSAAVSSSAKSQSFLLFGKPIHTDQAQQQQSGVSSSDGLGHPTVNDTGSPGLTSNSSTDGNPDHVDRFQGSRSAEVGNLSDHSGLWVHPRRQAFDYPADNTRAQIPWLKDNNGSCKISDDNISHCKVFMESEDVGRTLDLCLFSNYDQLHSRLAILFGIEDSDLSNRVLYKDAAGAVRHTGDEPYGEFVKTVRRLTILSDSGSDNLGR